MGKKVLYLTKIQILCGFSVSFVCSVIQLLFRAVLKSGAKKKKRSDSENKRRRG